MNVHRDEDLEILRNSAMQYEGACSAYDSIVCSGRTHEGEPVPSNPREQRLVSEHAARIIAKLSDETGFSRFQIARAIQRHNIFGLSAQEGENK